MIDQKVFDEMMNRGLITNVGLNSDDYEGIEDLMNRGLVTNVHSDKVYEELVNSLVNVEELTAKFLEDIKNGGTVKVPCDIKLSEYIEIRNDVTIDLNGHNIVHPMSSPSKYPDVFEVFGNATLEIIGNGKVIAENGYAVCAVGDSKVTIKDGEYFSPVSGVYCQKNGSVTILGGTFKVDGSNNPEGDFGQTFTLNLRGKVVTSDGKDYTGDKSQIIVKGGKFYKFDPANNGAEGPNTNFMAEDYESVKEGDWYVVRKKTIDKIYGGTEDNTVTDGE